MFTFRRTAGPCWRVVHVHDRRRGRERLPCHHGVAHVDTNIYADLFRALGGSVDQADTDKILREVQRKLVGILLENESGPHPVLNKATILRRGLQHAYTCGPIEQVASRVKAVDSLLQRMERLACPPAHARVRQTIQDIAGARVPCALVDDVYQFADMPGARPCMASLTTK